MRLAPGGAAGEAGANGSGGTPSAPGRVLSAGTYHSLGIIDGIASAWGSNRAGEMGLGTNAPEVHATPVPINAVSDVIAFAAGGYQSLALTSAGKVWSFGANEAGQRGDGSPASDLNGNGTPVLRGLTKVVAVASGGRHNLALTSDGKVYAWGANDNGQLGLGGAVLTSQCGGAVGSTPEAYRKHEPTLVPIDAKLVKIAAGYCFSAALDDAGHIWTWGFGDYQNANLGRGNGASDQWSTPAMIPSIEGAQAISAGDSCAFALRKDGKVASWGVNREGCVGDGRQSVRSAPVTLSLTNVVAIEARAQGAYAILADGSLWSWGESMYGSTGNGTFTDKATLDSPDRVYVTSPVRIEDWKDVVSVHSGPASNHVFAVRADGTVYSWGRNKSGNLGNGKIGDSDSTNQTSDDENVAEPELVEL